MTDNCTISLRTDCIMENAAAQRKVPGAHMLLHRESKRAAQLPALARDRRHPVNASPLVGSTFDPQPGPSMRRHLALFALLALAVSAPAALSAQDSNAVKQDRKEVRHDRRELRGDRRDIRHDTKDIRQDRREVRQDWKNGDTTEARREARDLRQDRGDWRHDVRDARRDRRDLRQDRKDLHQDKQEKQDSTE